MVKTKQTTDLRRIIDKIKSTYVVKEGVLFNLKTGRKLLNIPSVILGQTVSRLTFLNALDIDPESYCNNQPKSAKIRDLKPITKKALIYEVQERFIYLDRHGHGQVRSKSTNRLLGSKTNVAGFSLSIGQIIGILAHGEIFKGIIQIDKAKGLELDNLRFIRYT